MANANSKTTIKISTEGKLVFQISVFVTRASTSISSEANAFSIRNKIWETVKSNRKKGNKNHG